MRIYHLLPAEFAINNIALKCMKISRYDDLNDPFELMSGNLGDKDLRIALTLIKKEFQKEHGLLCFSKSWKNPVLWSHYADKHRGIALGFDVDDLYLTYVKYSNKRLDIKFNDGKILDHVDHAFIDKLLCTKYKHWEYEEELRLHVDMEKMKDENGIYFLDFESANIELKEVILGHSCELSIDKIRGLIDTNYKGVNVTKARLAFQEFHVVTDQRFQMKKMG